MGVTRTFGLIFFMTLLIGGCILAVTADPSSQPAVARTQDHELYVALLLKGGVAQADLVAPAGNLRADQDLCQAACTGFQDPFEEVNG